MLNIFPNKINGASVGYCDITTHMREDFQYARIGYTIFNQFWQQGYAKEAIHAIVQIGFEDLNFHRLEVHINKDNDISKRLFSLQDLYLNALEKNLLWKMVVGSIMKSIIYLTINIGYKHCNLLLNRFG